MRGLCCSVTYAVGVILILPLWLPIAFVADLISGDNKKYNIKINNTRSIEN
jgi:hypothetical protein